MLASYSPRASLSNFKLTRDPSRSGSLERRRDKLAWAFVLKSEELTVEAAGRGARGINQSELIAVLEGLDRITDPAEVVVFTDSVYAILAGKGRFRGVLQERLNAHRGEAQDHGSSRSARAEAPALTTNVRTAWQERFFLRSVKAATCHPDRPRQNERRSL